jgi:vacuolar-type H+-ATPase subunit H
MHKVWDELKSIEAQADQIQSDAKEKAKQITVQAQKDAQTLLANSKTYAAEESKKRFDAAVAEANMQRKTLLDQTAQSSKQLRTQAEKRMTQAVDAVVEAVLEEKVA